MNMILRLFALNFILNKTVYYFELSVVTLALELLYITLGSPSSVQQFGHCGLTVELRVERVSGAYHPLLRV